MTTDETPTRPPLTPAAKRWLELYPRVLEVIEQDAPNEIFREHWTWVANNAVAIIERTGDIPPSSLRRDETEPEEEGSDD